MDDKIFNMAMELQMAETRSEAVKILRTDPNLTEEMVQEMAQLWPEEDILILLKELELTDRLSDTTDKEEAISPALKQCPNMAKVELKEKKAAVMAENIKTGITEEEMRMLASGKMTADEWMEWAARKREKNKGVSQAALDILLDLTIPAKEALNRSAEISIKEAEKEQS